MRWITTQDKTQSKRHNFVCCTSHTCRFRWRVAAHTGRMDRLRIDRPGRGGDHRRARSLEEPLLPSSPASFSMTANTSPKRARKGSDTYVFRSTDGSVEDEEFDMLAQRLYEVDASNKPPRSESENSSKGDFWSNRVTMTPAPLTQAKTMVWGVDSDEDDSSELLLGKGADPPQTWRAVLTQLGPGLIVTASVVGSGEVFATPILAAENGFSLLWFVILSSACKVFLQVELGRYSMAKNQTSLEMLNSVPGLALCRVRWLVWLWLLMAIGSTAKEGGMLSTIPSLVVSRATQPWCHLALSFFTAAVIWGGICFGRYDFIETVCLGLTCVFSLFTILTLIACQSLGDECRVRGRELAAGFKFQLPHSFSTAFATFGLTGMSAHQLIFYPYWCLEKGYGAHLGPARPDVYISTPISKMEEDEEDDEEEEEDIRWLERGKGWIRVMAVDAFLSCAVYTAITCCFYLLGAATLAGQKVSNQDVLELLSGMYASAFGERVGKLLFRFGLFSVFFSTIYSNTASFARCLTDVFCLFRNAPCESQSDQLRKTHIFASCYLVVAFVLGYVIDKPVTLVFLGAFASGAFMPFLALAVLYLMHTQLDPRLLSGPTWRFFLSASVMLLVLVGFYGCYAAVQEFGQ
eukprot:g48721.t1